MPNTSVPPDAATEMLMSLSRPTWVANADASAQSSFGTLRLHHFRGVPRTILATRRNANTTRMIRKSRSMGCLTERSAAWRRTRTAPGWGTAPAATGGRTRARRHAGRTPRNHLIAHRRLNRRTPPSVPERLSGGSVSRSSSRGLRPTAMRNLTPTRQARPEGHGEKPARWISLQSGSVVRPIDPACTRWYPGMSYRSMSGG